jgi:hypothetical protein
MNIWRNISWANGEEFVHEVRMQMQQPPVFWNLAPFGEVTAQETELVARGFAVRRRSESHTLEIEFTGLERLDEEGTNLLRAVAVAEDQRELFPAELPLRSGVTLEFGTQVPVRPVIPVPPVTAESIPVVGPGGRAVVYTTTRGFSGDLTIRRRLNSSPGFWRAPNEIVARLKCDCPGSPSHVYLRMAFGYFELSKYELQSIMRPVFVFSVEQPQDIEGRWPGWQLTIVEPATMSPKVDLDDGLGLWVD